MEVRDPKSASPIRVALVTTELRPGGAERCLTKLALGLDRAVFSPQVYSLAPPPPHDASQLVDSLRDMAIPVHFIGAAGKTQFFGAVRKLRMLLGKQSPHVVQSFLFHANVACALAMRRGRTPLFGGLRVAQPQSHRQFIERRLAKHFAGFVCVSQAVAEHAANVGRLPREKLHVIPNAVDVAAFENVTPFDFTVIGVPPQRRVILFVGRLDAQKGPDLLLEAARSILPNHPAYNIVFVGDGPERAALETIVRRHSLESRVHFAGWHPDVASCLAAAELVVLPSRYEGMSNVLLEAMAAGKPVVAASVEGVAEVLGPLAAQQVCTASDVDAFASAVMNMLALEPAARHALGAANRQRVGEKFSQARMVDAYAELYRSAVDAASL